MDETKCENTEEAAGKKIIHNIVDNYKHLEQSIVSQLMLSNDLHPYTTGSSREDIWLQLFEMIVPKKFVIEHSVFIIDSYKHVSKEVDLAIIDNNYTPYIFQFGRLKYVPIEAVAAVIECKSTKVIYRTEEPDDGKKICNMASWCASIERLTTSMNSIARFANTMMINGKNCSANSAGNSTNTSTQTATRPIRIFCGYKTEMSDSSETMQKMRDFFDFILIAKQSSKGNRIDIKYDEELSFVEWYKKLDHDRKEGQCEELKHDENTVFVPIKVDQLNDINLKQYKIKQEEEDISLLSFNFQLNQLLMLINNPMLFPHKAYVDMFKSGIENSHL